MEEPGYVAEGFVNLPMGENAAIRLVGWAKHEAGWIDNVAATRLYEGDQSTDCRRLRRRQCASSPRTTTTRSTRPARARQLRIDLGENWTRHARSSMYQKRTRKVPGPTTSRRHPGPGTSFRATRRSRISATEFANDEWYQAGLTVEGSIGNWDVVYSGNYLDRDQ